MGRTTIIRLPEDHAWIELLKAKQRQYEDRIERYGLAYKPPELFERPNYAYMLLKELLEQGQIDTWALSRKWGALGWLDVEMFNDRCGVIYRYVQDRDYLQRKVGEYAEAHGVA